MGSIAVVGGAGTGIYYVVNNFDQTEKAKPKPEPGTSSRLTKTNSLTTPTTSPSP